MAHRIGVLEKDQPLTAQPTTHVRRVQANSLVRRGLAIWVADRLIQRVDSRTEAANAKAVAPR